MPLLTLEQVAQLCSIPANLHPVSKAALVHLISNGGPLSPQTDLWRLLFYPNSDYLAFADCLLQLYGSGLPGLQ